MSYLSHQFNAVWPDLPDTGDARNVRVYMEVRRLMTGRPLPFSLDRTRDLTVWELRLAELVVERLRSEPK